MHCHFHFPKMQRKRNSWLIHLETDAKLRDRKSFKENRKPEAGSCYFVFIHLVQMAVTRAKMFLLKKLSPLSLPDNGFFFSFRYISRIWMVKWWLRVGKKYICHLTGDKRRVFDYQLRCVICKTCWELKNGVKFELILSWEIAEHFIDNWDSSNAILIVNFLLKINTPHFVWF